MDPLLRKSCAISTSQISIDTQTLKIGIKIKTLDRWVPNKDYMDVSQPIFYKEYWLGFLFTVYSFT